MRTSTGRKTFASAVELPTCVSRVIARAVARHVVRLSGVVSSMLASPFSSVSSWPFQTHVSGKSLRTSASTRSPPPESSFAFLASPRSRAMARPGAASGAGAPALSADASCMAALPPA